MQFKKSSQPPKHYLLAHLLVTDSYINREVCIYARQEHYNSNKREYSSTAKTQQEHTTLRESAALTAIMEGGVVYKSSAACDERLCYGTGDDRCYP